MGGGGDGAIGAAGDGGESEGAAATKEAPTGLGGSKGLK